MNREIIWSGRNGTMEKVIYIEKKQYLVDRAVENNLREAGLQVCKVA